MQVALVQWASSLDPADNRAALADLPPPRSLVVLPEAFARDFGAPGSDVSPRRRAAGRSVRVRPPRRRRG